jgi:ATP-dependent helicase/nuclease subunit A
MSDEQKGVHRLIDAQMSAVEPESNIWLSASAGTGKTQVLTARVIRLLLQEDVNPENILCITFTKAGASEMAERINNLLASWVQMENTRIFRDLEAIGAVSDIPARQKASRLFAKVLDAPGGGLQIMTIHSLCQSLLGSFPEEAGLLPGFKPVEGREQEQLYNEALAEMIIASEAEADDWVVKNLQSMSLEIGEEAAFKFLKRCACEPAAIDRVPVGNGAVVYTRALVGVNFEGSLSAMVENACSDSVIDRKSIEQIALLNAEWGTKTGLERADAVRDWLALDVAQRAVDLNSLLLCWSTKTGTIAKVVPKNDAYEAIAHELFHWSRNLQEQITLAAYAERLAKALLIGKVFSAHYAKGKAQRGLVDFDDMIRKTADMLTNGAMAQWVKFKLDRQIDHILVDEAQDTNAAQWDIIRALCDDFFSGVGAKGERNRTIFSVGDYKQAIFGFQGTDPQRYAAAGVNFGDKISRTGGELQKLELSQSFRSTGPVLDFINSVIAQAGHERFGVTSAIADHYGDKPDCGMIELFAPVNPPNTVNEPAADGDEEAAESWLTKEKVILAHRIASYVRRLIDEQPILQSTGKPLNPGDIMILLRNRSDLAASLVGRLHAANVPVSGIDRLKLVEPIAVQDLMAAVRFVLQPGDDMSLACLLVSPIFGWSQERLLQFGYRPKTIGLWEHLRGKQEIAVEAQELRAILAMADFTTAYQFFETILSGPLQARKKMVARLGAASLVPIEELLNAALQFEQNHGGTLQAFLAWFESGDSDVKREGLSGNNEVRILTVHGSKGLQAPVVILADVTGDPESKPAGSNELMIENGSRLPLLTIRSAEKVGWLEEATAVQGERELKEHARLLYVAITRAQERLVMAGALGRKAKGVAAPESWYCKILAGLEAMGCDWQPESSWGRVMRYRGAEAPKVRSSSSQKPSEVEFGILPSWLLIDAPEEVRPPKPLVPSHIDSDDYGDAPATAAMRLATEKGRLIHSLFERLASHDIEKFDQRAMAWLEGNNTESKISNTEIVASVRAVISKPEWAAFFGSDSHAEIPLAAVVGETVITGRVDRLVIEPGLIRVLDFKTGRNVPKSMEYVPVAYIRQMAHYVAALETIFTSSQVEASLLFTHEPRLITLTSAELVRHKPACYPPI